MSFAKQLPLPLEPFPVDRKYPNRISVDDQAFHGWYRFVLAFPPHLVRDYIKDFGLGENHTLLDPFCGTGTTLVEARLCGIPSIGSEANIFTHFASQTKIDWSIDPKQLQASANAIGAETREALEKHGLDDDNTTPLDFDLRQLEKLPPETEKLLLTNSISPIPLHKTLALINALHSHRMHPYHSHLMLALANALILKISNLHFGPEVGVGRPKWDIPVIAAWLSEIDKMVNDLSRVHGNKYPKAEVYRADARDLSDYIPVQSIDAVITSPPYPNEKDYTRITRLESVLLGFIHNKLDLRTLKQNLIRSNTRGVYKGDSDDKWILEEAKIQMLAEEIERRRIALNKTSGFEKLYSKVTRLYFGGMARHLAGLRPLLRPGAQLAYVVGDQASYLRVHIPTGQLLAEIATKLGYELVRIDLFRTRFSTATKSQLREEVVILHWTGRYNG